MVGEAPPSCGMGISIRLGDTLRAAAKISIKFKDVI
jgi:hypothetical protein